MLLRVVCVCVCVKRRQAGKSPLLGGWRGARKGGDSRFGGSRPISHGVPGSQGERSVGPARKGAGNAAWAGTCSDSVHLCISAPSPVAGME